MTAKLYKIEIRDHGDDEVNNMAVAYEACRRLPHEAHERCIGWLLARLADDRKKAEPLPEDPTR